MGKNLFDSLSPAATFATKLFSAAGLDLGALMATGDANALKAHLDSVASGAGAKEAIEQATAQLTADLAARETSLSTATAQLTTVLSALATAGIQAKADATPEALSAALTSRVTKLAGEELAKRGLRDFPEQVVSADPTKPAAAGRATMSLEEHRALDPHARAEFFRKGGRLTD